MTLLLSDCWFTNATGGTADFVYSGGAGDYASPTVAGAVNGQTYLYRAQTYDGEVWEVGLGVYTSGTKTFARTTVLFNSLGTTAKINFSTPPHVVIREDDPTEAAMAAIAALSSSTAGAVHYDIAQSLTAPQSAQARANIDAPGLSVSNTFTVGMTVVAPDYNNFYKLTSNTPGNPAPTKFWRIDANGSLAVVNSANTAEIFNLTDTGALSVGDAAGTRTNLGTVAKAGDTITGNLQVNGALGAGPLVGGSGDLSSVRSASAADGIVFLGNSGSRYLYYNSAAGQYQLNGAHVTSAAGRLWGASDFSAPLQLTGGQMSGNLIAINTANIASGGGVGSFETRGNGTVTNAAMSFHLPGVFAANFGMANDGNFYMGGWSHGAVAYRFYTTRDFNYTPVNKAGDTITGGLTVNGELVAATNYLRFVSSGSAGYIQWNGGNNYGLGGGGTIFHTGNINPIIDGRLAYVADFTYTSGLQEPYGGSVITGGQPTTRQYRHRYMQLQNSAGTWYTVGYV